MFPFSKKGQ